MRGSDKVIAVLNEMLAEELTAINQYMVQSEMCSNWGYEGLHKQIEKIAIVEMKHAEKLIGRILFLEGQPTVSKLNQLQIGEDVKAIIYNDLRTEKGAIQDYNGAVALCVAENDRGSAHLLREILEDEEQHIDWFEAQHHQIEQLGLPNYLISQVKG